MLTSGPKDSGVLNNGAAPMTSSVLQRSPQTARLFTRFAGACCCTSASITLTLPVSFMQYTSSPPSKIDYARYLAAALFYLAIHNQRDAAGLIVFDEEVREYIRPSTRPGQLTRLFAGLEQATPRARTDFAKPLQHFQNALHRRGIAVVVSDFYKKAETIIANFAPLRFRGNEVILFQILDPQEIRPALKEPAILVDLENNHRIEVIPEYTNTVYRTKIDAHVEQLRSRARAAGMDYHLLVTTQPLDLALREYLTLRQEGD